MQYCIPLPSATSSGPRPRPQPSVVVPIHFHTHDALAERDDSARSLITQQPHRALQTPSSSLQLPDGLAVVQYRGFTHFRPRLNTCWAASTLQHHLVHPTPPQPLGLRRAARPFQCPLHPQPRLPSHRISNFTILTLLPVFTRRIL